MRGRLTPGPCFACSLMGSVWLATLCHCGPTRVTYAFVELPVRVPEARNCDGMVQVDALLAHSGISLAVFRNKGRAAFNMWEQATNISVRETNDTPTAGILIGAQALPEGWAIADVAQRADHSDKIEESLICLKSRSAMEGRLRW